MTTRTEYLQRLFKEYALEHNHTPTSMKDVAKWAVEKGKLHLPDLDPLDVLTGQFSKALRDETAIDSQGKTHRVNHAVREKKDGVQTTLWANMSYAPRSHMERSFSQRREGIISDCVQLKHDVDAYNDQNPDKEPVQLVLDFTDDVAERELISQEEIAA